MASEELLLKIGMQDTASKSLRTLNSTLRSLDGQLQATAKYGNLLGSGTATLGTRFSQLQSKIGTMKASMNLWKTTLTNSNNAIRDLQGTMTTLANKGEENSAAYQSAESSLNKYKDQAIKAQNAINLLETQITTATQELSIMGNQLDNINLLKFGERMQSVGTTLQTTGDRIQNVGRGISTIGTTITNLTAPFALATIGAAKAAIAYEEAFTGVEKTIDGTEQQLSNLSTAIRDMSKEMPTSANDIAAVAEAAGQLGVKIDSVEDFTKVMVMLGDTTNLSATDAATSIAKLLNVMGNTDTTTEEYGDTVERLGAALVDLGNNTATTEADILAMSQRLGAAGYQVGMSEQEVLALSATLSSLGLEAEMGNVNCPVA